VFHHNNIKELTHMKLIFLCLLLSGITACGAGSGDGLNEQGLPITDDNSSEPTNEVSLAQLQEEIFGAICAACHTGANAPRGLRLDSAENAYAYLVNQAADEVPELMRVNPGNPDDSYIIRKLEGADTIVGGQMPLGGPYLTQEQINKVRAWITNGAPLTGTGVSSNVEQVSDGGDRYVYP